MDPTLSRNIKFKAAEGIFSIITSILQFGIISRALPIETVGVYSLSLAYAFYLTALTFEAGIGMVTLRDLSQGKDPKKLISNAFAASLFVIIPLAGLTVLALLHIPYFALIAWPLGCCAAVIFVRVLLGIGSVLLYSEKQIPKIVLCNLLGQIVATLWLCYLYSQNSVSLNQVLLVYAVSNLLPAILIFWLSKALRYLSLAKVDFSKLGLLFREAGPIVLMVVLTHLYVRIDNVLIDYFMGKEAVSKYAMAYNFLDYLMILSNFMIFAFFPNFAKFALSDLEKFKRLYHDSILPLIKYLFPLAGLIAIFSSTLLTWAYGPAFKEAALTLSALMAAALFAWLNAPAGSILITLKKQALYTWGCAVSLLVNVAGNFIMIPICGYLGAAIATALTEAALCCFCAVMIYRQIGYVPFLFSKPQ